MKADTQEGGEGQAETQTGGKADQPGEDTARPTWKQRCVTCDEGKHTRRSVFLKTWEDSR